jgi:negative regulator of flagellin synthesis FlgM
MKVKDSSEIRRLDANGPAESKKTRAEGNTPAASDKVSTDAKAQFEAAAASARKALGNNRNIRLEAIEAAVRQGTFKPDPQRIAQKILADAELSAMLQVMLTAKAE